MNAKIQVQKALTKSLAFSEEALGFDITVRVERFEVILRSNLRRNVGGTWHDTATFADIQYSGDAIIGNRIAFEKSLVEATEIATRENNVLDSGYTQLAESAVLGPVFGSTAALTPTIFTILIPLIAVFFN